jgi:DNA-binding response OmpR family regulator
VRARGSLVPLTATEFRLLEYLLGHPGVVFTREQLLNAVWGWDRAITNRAVDVYILRLRQKLEADPANPALIHSARGFGYRLAPHAEEHGPAA